jgi:UDPglucose 6-dehydrogenase
MNEEKTLGVPQPDDDVLNAEPKVLLIGYGWVGQYCGKYFTKADIYTSKGYQRHEITGKYDLAIISVPTPMDPKTGQCDTSIVESMVELFQHTVNYFLIKSTVEIGTTDRLAEKYKVKIAMSPEYIGETLGHPLLEARRDAFQIIGGTDETAAGVAECWKKVLHASAPIMICTAKEAEIIKYCENLWIIQRVDYWNDVYEVCNTLGGNFMRVREGIVLDPRMNRTHSNVYPENRGYSSKCVPKDPNALVYLMRKSGNPLTTVEQQLEKNAIKWRGSYKNKERLLPINPLWKENEKN